MEQNANLTGFWRFSEEFDKGEDVGEARLFQKGKTIKGYLVFKEITENAPPLFVRTQLKGRIEKGQVHLSETSAMILSRSSEDYELEERTGLINTMGQIVGSGEDAQGVHGVFVLERIF